MLPIKAENTTMLSNCKQCKALAMIFFTMKIMAEKRALNSYPLNDNFTKNMLETIVHLTKTIF